MKEKIDISKIKIESPRLILRGLKDYDLYDVFDILKYKEVADLAVLDQHKTIEQSKIFLDFMIEDNSTLGIELIDERKLIGYISFMEFDEKIDEYIDSLSSYYIGYIINKKYQRKGYGSEALEMVIPLAFNELDMDFLICEYLEENIPSKKLIDKFNFTYVGDISVETCDYEIKKGKRTILFKDNQKELLKHFKKDG